MDYKYSVFIGRFQPIHNSHLEMIKFGLEQAENLIIAIGSTDASPSVKNPWSFEERVKMVDSCLSVDERARTNYVQLRDYYYNYNLWVVGVQSQVQSITHYTPDSQICLIGNYKDSSSYYLNAFPQWGRPRGKDTKLVLNATDVRHDYFARKTTEQYMQNWTPSGVHWQDTTPPQVCDYLMHKWRFTPTFQLLQDEYEFIQQYRAKWAHTPYPVTFVTVDAVVIKSGHVLIVHRRDHPGKGLKALPGGFVEQDETITDACIRELKDETSIQVDKPVLRRYIKTTRVYDYPSRDPRGRAITHAHLIDLGEGPLPKVKGGDDATHAEWVPIRQLIEQPRTLFADHFHIIFNLLYFPSN